MSGRPKPTEAESLRQLTREAHEAIKDLRGAIREARAERDACRAFLEGQLQAAVEAGVQGLTVAAHERRDQLQEIADDAMEHLAELLGTTDHPDLVDAITNRAAEQLASQLVLGIDEDGQPVIRERSDYRRGEVFVTTDPALAPPGSLILDARDE